MSKKKQRIDEFVAIDQESGLNPHYTGYFHCFNRGLFFEAHEVLEVLWLIDRRGAEGGFYKGLIQLAGAFVHLQKHRPGPAAALFRLARTNLGVYPRLHHRLDVAATIALIDRWQKRLEKSADVTVPLTGESAPSVKLVPKTTP